MDPEVRAVHDASEVPKDTNVFMYVLDAEGKLVHGFKGLPGGRNPTWVKDELAKAVAKLKIPEVKGPAADGLPDVKSGVRMFIRSGGGKNVIVEALPMDWKPLAWPERAREIPAETLRDWLVQLYPAAIRTVDQSKPFKTVAGTLTLSPAEGRRAVLRGTVKLSKGDEKESSFEGTLEAAVTYAPDAPEVRSLRGVVEGVYTYRMRVATEYKMVAAIESRPE